MAVNTLTTAMVRKLDDFTAAYVEEALADTTDNTTSSGGYPLDRNYNADDIAAETLRGMIEDCRLFQEEAGDVILKDLEMAGRHFWMTRNGAGHGFWAGDWPEEDEGRLTDLAKGYGEYNLDAYQGIIYGM